MRVRNRLSENGITIGKNKIAEELLQIIRDSCRNPVIQLLNYEDRVTRKEFGNSRLSKDFWLDTRQYYIDSKKNLMLLFQLFETWSTDSPTDLKSNIMSLVNDNYMFYKCISMFWTRYKGIDFDTWIYDQIVPYHFADELMLFVLCR